MPPIFSAGTWGQQVSQRFPVKLLCLLEKFKGSFRNRRQARNWKCRSGWGTEGSKKDAAAAKSFKLRKTMNKLERTMEEPQAFVSKSSSLCSATFPARFLFKYHFKYHFASTPTSLPGKMPHRVSPPFSICSSGHPPSKTRFFSLWFFLGGKVATGFSWALKSESILWKPSVNAWIAAVGGKWKYKGDTKDPEWGLDVVKQPSVRVGGFFLLVCPSPCPLMHVQVCMLRQELAYSR
jgi:hypothetical protein